MDSYLAVAARALRLLPPPVADEINERNGTSSAKEPSPKASFVNFVSFVGPFELSAVAEPVAWRCDGENYDGISDHLLMTLRTRAATGDAQAAKEAIELADYLASCDRGEVRWPAHPVDEELARWNHRCSAAACKKR
jgi:hypothetical protein